MRGVEPLVSVLVPAYNHVAYISETINSIVAQEYDNLELIVCDDNSSDGTWDIIKRCRPKCEKRFKKCVFFQKNHSGIHDSLTRMLRLASGKYIYIIASDDIAHPKAINFLCSFLEKNKKYGLVVGKNEIIDKNSKVVTKKYASCSLFSAELEKKNMFGKYWQLLYRNHIPNGYLISKEFFGDFIYNATTYEDYYMVLQISKKYEMKFLNIPLFFYRRHPNNTITSTEMQNKIFELDKNLILPELSYCEMHGYIELWAERFAQLICNCKIKIDLKDYILNLCTIYPESNWPKVLLGLWNVKEENYSKALALICEDNCFIKCEDNMIPYMIYIYNCCIKNAHHMVDAKSYNNQELISKLYFLIKQKKEFLFFSHAYFCALQALYFSYYLNISVFNVFKCFDTQYVVEQKIIYKLINKFFDLNNKNYLQNIWELKSYIAIAFYYKLKSFFC